MYLVPDLHMQATHISIVSLRLLLTFQVSFSMHEDTGVRSTSYVHPGDGVLLVI